MPTRNQAKPEWLRRAAKEGFDDMERGDYVTLRSGKEIDEVIDQLAKEASAESAVARGVADTFPEIPTCARPLS